MIGHDEKTVSKTLNINLNNITQKLNDKSTHTEGFASC